ncbi:MAG: NAD+ synthase [Chthoniobacterales bacterium]
MKIGLAQINSTIGDLAGNAERIFFAYQELVAQGAEFVITPELALTGYPPRDLLLSGKFVDSNLEKIDELEKKIGAVPLVVGFVDYNTTGCGRKFYNAAAVITKNQPRVCAHKRLLPNYDVFDESRYFEPGSKSTIVSVNGCNIGITICEDLWTQQYLPYNLYSVDPPEELVRAGAELIVNLSASPFEFKKPVRRLAMISAQAKRLNVPIAYCNAVGGNDQLIFDGHSLVVAAGGSSWIEMPGCREKNSVIAIARKHEIAGDARDEMEELYDALVLGLRDYFSKCGFKSAILGLSGGIDSALVAVIAVAALGSKAVTGILLPGPYSSQGSIDDAIAVAKKLSITTKKLPITQLYDKAIDSLKPVFSEYLLNGESQSNMNGCAEENIQARLRGMILMALSNKWGGLLLTTGNKSELAVGYCTLYGDMCGGLAVISDLPKMMVYQLARWINRSEEIIPWNSIEKPPSAELRPDQKDQDTLPPYEILDPILQLYIEENLSVAQIVARGFEEAIVRNIVSLIDRNEYKRQQAAPGLKVTGRAFGVGRRLSIAQKYRFCPESSSNG